MEKCIELKEWLTKYCNELSKANNRMQKKEEHLNAKMIDYVECSKLCR